jgi:hypothetical protein
VSGYGGMSWEDIESMRDSRARYFCKKHNYHHPLEEFLSMGNLAIAECCELERRGKIQYPRSYLWTRMSSRMREVFVRENKGKLHQHGGKIGELNGKIDVPLDNYISILWYEPFFDNAIDFRAFLDFFSSRLNDSDSFILQQWLGGAELWEIGVSFQCSASNIHQKITKIIKYGREYANKYPHPVDKRHSRTIY